MLSVAAVGCAGAIDGGASAPSGGSAGNGGPPGPAAPPPALAVPAGLRRLTRVQYRNTLEDLLGAGITLPTELDPDDPEAVFSSVGGYRITTSPAGVLKYEDAAYAVARQVMADPAHAAAVIGCDPKQGAACATSFVKGFGRRAWRRPLTDGELGRYVELVAGVTALLGTPEAGFEHALAGLLQSPNFMYLPEVGDRRGFTSHEIAARLAYLLTDRPPDPELSAAADRSELATAAGLQAQFDRLITSPRARPSLIGLFGQLLDLAQLDDLTKDPDVYPAASPALFAAMRTEAEKMIDETALVRRGALLDLLDAKGAFAPPELGKLYAGAGERGGIFTTGAWLAIQAKPYSSSPTLRGVWIRERLLCEDVPPPPPNVNNVLPNPTERAMSGAPRTTRQVLEDHRKDPACATCHALFDPIGVAFERFDGIGAYRTTEGKLPIDTAGTFDGKPFTSPADLAALLRADPRVAPCLVRQLYRAVSGHERLAAEDQAVESLAAGFTARPDLRDLLTRMVASDWYRAPGAPL